MKASVPVLGVIGLIHKKKHKKTAMFGFKICYLAYNSKITGRSKLKFGLNVVACWCFMQTEFGGLQVTWPRFYRPKMGRKLTILNRYILVIADIDQKWFAIFEHTINHSIGYVRLPQLNSYFCCFASFFLLFFFFFCCCLLQSCKSGRAFRVGFGPKVDKNFGLNLGLRRIFCLLCTKI